MKTASKREANCELDELQAALRTETELRLEAEDRLRRTHEDFEAFILHAAHDLKEPLRTVSAFCELLVRARRRITLIFGGGPSVRQYRT